MFVVYLVAIAVVCVWGAVVLRYGGFVGASLVVMLLACCFGYDFYAMRFGPLPLTSDRLAIVALGAVYLRSRWRGHLPAPRFDRWDVAFALFLAVLAVNTLLHDWRSRGAQPLANLVFLYLYPSSLYWIVRDSRLDAGQLRRVHWALATFSVYLALTAVTEVSQVTWLVYPRYILTSPFHEWLGRGRGPFLNPATNGMYMSAGLFALMICWPRVNRWGRAAIATGMGLVLVGIYCTLTRSCWIGALLGVALVAFAAASKVWRMPLLAGGVLLAGVVLLAKGDSFAEFKRDKNVSSFEMAQSAQLRPMLAVVAGKIAWDYPLFGCGFGQYPKVHGDYLHDPNLDMPLEKVRKYVQHNVLLSLLAETGLVGLLLYMAVVAGWVQRAWRNWRNHKLSGELRGHGLLVLAFFANWFVIGMFQDTNLMINGNLLVFLLAGLSQGIYASACGTGAGAVDPNSVDPKSVASKSTAPGARRYGDRRVNWSPGEPRPDLACDGPFTTRGDLL